MTTPELNVSAAFDRRLAWCDGGSVRHLVVTLTATAAEKSAGKTGPRKPLNLALVIDASGSMSGPKLESAKRAALGVLDRLTERDRLTLVSFASDVRVEVDAVACTSAARETVRARLRELETRGCTNLSGGWFAGADCAAAVVEADPAMTPRVIILSDGLANEGICEPTSLAEHARQLRLRGVVTSTLGIGDGYDERLLLAIAENGGGRHHDAELAGEIEHVLLGEIDEAIETAIEAVALDVDLPPGVRVEVLGFGAATVTEGQASTIVGALEAGQPRPIAIRLCCPAGRAGDALEFRIRAEGRCSVTGSDVAAAPIAVQLCFAEGAMNGAQPCDIEIATIVSRAWHSDIVRRVAALNRSGDFRAAEKLLRHELRYVESYSAGLPGGSDLIRELTIMLHRIDRHWSERTHKEMSLSVELRKRQGTDHRGAGKMSWAQHLARE